MPLKSFINDVDVDFNNVIRTAQCLARNCRPSRFACHLFVGNDGQVVENIMAVANDRVPGNKAYIHGGRMDKAYKR